MKLSFLSGTIEQENNMNRETHDILTEELARRLELAGDEQEEIIYLQLLSFIGGLRAVSIYKGSING